MFSSFHRNNVLKVSFHFVIKVGDDINVKTTVIFGLINHIDPWADSELKKLHELGLYKIFEIDCKPIYRENVMVSYILAQIRGMKYETI